MSDEASLSIEDTNALRVKLGLKPLRLAPSSSATASSSSSSASASASAGGAPPSAAASAAASQVEAKLALAAKQRELNAKLAGPTIAEETDDSDATAWVQRSRSLAEQRQRQRQEAATRARALEELEAQLQRDAADTAAPSSLRVAHRVDELDNEQSVILTLADVPVLDGDEINTRDDVLENVDLAERRRLQANQQRRAQAKKPVYNAYEAAGAPDSALLAQYDDEDAHKHRLDPTRVAESEGFKLGDLQSEDERRRAEIRRKLALDAAARTAAISEYDASDDRKHVASEYMTSTEHARFRNGVGSGTTKAKRALRRKKASALLDELESAAAASGGGGGAGAGDGGGGADGNATAASSSSDRGSRSRGVAIFDAEAAALADEKQRRHAGWTRAVERAQELSRTRMSAAGSNLAATSSAESEATPMSTDTNSAAESTVAPAPSASHRDTVAAARMDTDNEPLSDPDEDLAEAMRRARRPPHTAAAAAAAAAALPKPTNLAEIAEVAAAARRRAEEQERQDELARKAAVAATSTAPSSASSRNTVQPIEGDLVFTSTTEFVRSLQTTHERQERVNAGLLSRAPGDLAAPPPPPPSSSAAAATASSTSSARPSTSSARGNAAASSATTGGTASPVYSDHDDASSARGREHDDNDNHSNSSDDGDDDDDEDSVSSNSARPWAAEQPVVSGVAATLQLLRQQGVRDEDLQLVSGRARDKEVVKTGTEGGFKLQYLDDDGRVLSQKEAYRKISYAFHGKAPGKKKQEKRLRQKEQLLRQKKMATDDTPLNSMKSLQEAQQRSGSAYVKLSAGATGAQVAREVMSELSVSKKRSTPSSGAAASSAAKKKA